MGDEGQEAAINNLETEFKDLNSNRGAWASIYQFLRNKCEKYDKQYPSDESKKPENRNFNRYRDVAPYDHTRIVLNRGSCDYINANLIEVEQAHRKYILTQGPLPQTAGHFWLMTWEQNSKAILMLNKVIEKNQIKCHQYWPLEGSSSHTMMFPDVGLKVEYVTKVEKTDYTTRTLRLTDVETKESRDILHFHYTTWPDFGVPKSPTAFLSFLEDVRQSGALDENVGPAIVHCSAGIGRSGTFCVVDTTLLLIENGYDDVNIREILLEMRKSRMGLIQTPDQLKFSYMAVIEGFKHTPDNNNVNDDNSSTEEDELPPVIPPRGESLKPRPTIDDTPSPTNENANNVSSPPDKPLPHEPAVGNDTNNVNNTHDQHGVNSESDEDNQSFQSVSPPSSPETKLRHRRKNERLAEQVRDIKRRQKETEEWQNFKRSKNETVQEEPEPTS